jgi:NAD-dependent SIR2 family protein deacetylase
MLNADDPYTPASLNRLKEAMRRKRPLVLWIGAGASRWAGLPSWHDSARQMRRTFIKSVPAFPDDVAKPLLSSKAYPDLFQLCRDEDSKLYNKTLSEQFSSPTIGPLYEQFIEMLKKMAPLQIVTTNVDLCLAGRGASLDTCAKT